WGAQDFEEPATLLTSELVTNAVLHARSALEVTLRFTDGQLWVGVSDSNKGSPVRKRYGPDAGTGRGLLLVERIASAWGTELSASGKVVWFRLTAGAEDAAMAALAADFEADLDDLAGGVPSGSQPGRSRHRARGPRPAVHRRHPAPHREGMLG
ncbi:MAG TPA: ATP-binding protein, partial [Acidimicrobiales bacterium]|nr:ATP-binding protein [Acidimicrobiales bacterium]